VAGGGPAGTSAAISLAQRGRSVVLFERETFPRFHIGESLLSTANDAFAALGIAERMDAEQFPVKWGARLITHDGAAGRGVNFASVAGLRRPQTIHVPRAEFDRILMDRAREVGVDVREAHRVTSCDFAADGAMVGFANDAEEGRVQVRAIVDATGRQGLIARKYDLRTDEPRLANIAIYAHYSGVPLLDDDRPNDIRIVACEDAGWFWLIPISAELMSVGVVLPKPLFQQMPDGKISNLYTLKILNKIQRDLPIDLRLENASGQLTLMGSGRLVVPKESLAETSVLVAIDPARLPSHKTKLRVGVYSAGKHLETINTIFIGPRN